MCKCTCCGGRNICGPIIPPNEKAYNFRIGLIVIIVLHFICFVVKAWFLGFFSALTDIVAITILILAIIRFDYCQLMVYIVLNLSEVFALIVVLGYYLQTDMGKNAPKRSEEESSEDNAGKHKSDGKDSNPHDKGGSKESMAFSMKMHHHSYNGRKTFGNKMSSTIFFRDFIDTLL